MDDDEKKTDDLTDYKEPEEAQTEAVNDAAEKEEQPPRRTRVYRRRREETAAERLERILRQAQPPTRPVMPCGETPEEITRRNKRSIMQLREHCRKRGIQHPLFDKDWNEEVND